MVSWAVTGATRGIGLEYINNLSADAQNQVFAIIRSRSTAAPLEALASKRPNLHIIVTDLADTKKLATAAASVSTITGGSLDFLILNAGSTTDATSQIAPAGFHGKEELLEKELSENIQHNLISNVYTINAFLPLIRAGTEKKIIFISSQSGNTEFTRITGISNMVGYSVAKAGTNMVVTKYASELAPEGILTLSMSPGWVATDAAKKVTGDPEVRKFILGLFHKLDPNVQGPAPVDVAVNNMLRVIRGLTEKDSGKFLTHHGDDDTWF